MDYEIKKRANNAYVVCQSCGEKYGRNRKASISTWHKGRCDICYKKKAVAEFKDYGFSKYQE